MDRQCLALCEGNLCKTNKIVEATLEDFDASSHCFKVRKVWPLAGWMTRPRKGPCLGDSANFLVVRIYLPVKWVDDPVKQDPISQLPNVCSKDIWNLLESTSVPVDVILHSRGSISFVHEPCTGLVKTDCGLHKQKVTLTSTYGEATVSTCQNLVSPFRTRIKISLVISENQVQPWHVLPTQLRLVPDSDILGAHTVVTVATCLT